MVLLGSIRVMALLGWLVGLYVFFDGVVLILSDDVLFVLCVV